MNGQIPFGIADYFWDEALNPQHSQSATLLSGCTDKANTENRRWPQQAADVRGHHNHRNNQCQTFLLHTQLRA